MTPRIVLWSMVAIVIVAVIYFAKPAHAWEGTVGMIVGTEIGEGNTGVYMENLQEGGYRIVFISNTDNDPRVIKIIHMVEITTTKKVRGKNQKVTRFKKVVEYKLKTETE